MTIFNFNILSHIIPVIIIHVSKMSLITVYEMYCSIATQHNTIQYIRNHKDASHEDYKHGWCMYRTPTSADFRMSMYVYGKGKTLAYTDGHKRKCHRKTFECSSERGVDPPPTNPPSSAEVKERVDLYLYSPSGTSWHVLSWTVPLTIGN